MLNWECARGSVDVVEGKPSMPGGRFRACGLSLLVESLGGGAATTTTMTMAMATTTTTITTPTSIVTRSFGR